MPSWSTGAGWAPGSFTPASPVWFNAKNQIGNARLGITYDTAGNLTAIGGFTFAYDAENRLVSSTLNSVTTNYVYDGEGRRVKKGPVVMVYDAFGRLAAEYGGTAEAVGTEYLTADHLGSTRLVTSSTGAERRCLDYLPFGEQMTQGMGTRGACYASTGEPRVKFTGKERDGETGLDYFGARYFSGAQGRFMSPDLPLVDQNVENPQSWSLYVYARNNPLRNRDLDGRICIFGIGNTCDEKLPPPPPPPPPPSAPALTSPLMASSISGLRVNSLTVQQVGNVVFNETQSLSTREDSNEPIEAARTKVAQVVINGDQLLGDARPVTGSTSGPSQAQLRNSVVADAYASSQAAAREAFVSYRLGLPDPTGGALNFNLRPNASTGPFFGIPLATQSGPYANSYPSRDLPAGRPVYINTYRRRRP